MRKLMLTGRLAADAQKQVTNSGSEYLTFRLGNSEYNDEKDSEGKPITYWFRASTFNPQLFNLLPHLLKGKPVTVIGNYRDSIYQNKKTGNCEISRDIMIDSISFVEGASNNTNPTSSQTTTKTITTAKTEMPKVTNTATPTTSAVNTSASTDDEDDLPF